MKWVRIAGRAGRRIGDNRTAILFASRVLSMGVHAVASIGAAEGSRVPVNRYIATLRKALRYACNTLT